MKWVITIFVVALLAGGALRWFRNHTQDTIDTQITHRPMTEKIQITTKDNVKIVGDYYSALSTKGAVLLHMMPATKESWITLAAKLQSAGFQVLAIDLRGHGKSGGGPDGYKSFSDKEHQASIQDVEAAAEFLKTKGVSELYLGGASIGANLALWYAADHPEIKKVILLSAGLNYYGIITESFAIKLQSNQSAYFVGDEDDMRKSGDSAAHMAQVLFDTTSAAKSIKIFKGAGHGTDMLTAHPEFEDELMGWLLK